MLTFRLFWNDNTFEDIKGNSIEDAFLNSGYELNDIASLIMWIFI